MDFLDISKDFYTLRKGKKQALESILEFRNTGGGGLSSAFWILYSTYSMAMMDFTIRVDSLWKSTIPPWSAADF